MKYWDSVWKFRYAIKQRNLNRLTEEFNPVTEEQQRNHLGHNRDLRRTRSYDRADRNLAYSHSIQRVAGTDKEGKKLDLTVRATDVYQKIGGRWFIVHEHVSVPVDLGADKPDLASKP